MGMNPILLEIIGNALVSIAEQMGVILMKTGYSTNIKERKDLSVAIFSAKGELLSLAQHIPIHFSSLSGAVDNVLKLWNEDTIYDGDVFIANDPYTGGGSHLSDIVLLRPVFYQGKLTAFVVNLGHHADRTGRGQTIYDEGLRIPPVKLYEKGKLNDDMYRLILLNFQLKKERKGDFNAQLITNKFGEDKIIELCDKIGIDTFNVFCDEWLKYGERKVKAAIAKLPDGKYTFEDYLDSDGYDAKDVRIKAMVEIEGENIKFDFSGSSGQVKGPFNCIFSALKATVYYTLLVFLDKTIPANSGFFNSIEISAPEKSIVNAAEPAATVDRETATQRIADAIFGCLAQIDCNKVTAAGNGCVCYFNFLGMNRQDDSPYVYAETIGGGSGARYNKDGLDAVQVNMTNTSNLPVEALELEYPLIVRKYELVEDSMGAGQYRGGLGIRRSIQITDDSVNTSVSATTERFVSKPWGLNGGGSAGNSQLMIIRDGVKMKMPSKIRNYPLKTGDVVELVTPGGGGFGDASHRAKDDLDNDLRGGIMSRKFLKDNYADNKHTQEILGDFA